MAGAGAALERFGVPDRDARAERYAAAKQQQLLELIEEGRLPHAVLYRGLLSLGWLWRMIAIISGTVVTLTRGRPAARPAATS